jgi:hypothetical protein
MTRLKDLGQYIESAIVITIGLLALGGILRFVLMAGIF